MRELLRIWFKNLTYLNLSQTKSSNNMLIHVSEQSFQKSLNASLEFDASKLRQNISWMESEVDAAKNKISDLADENDRLKQYTRRTNLCIFSIPESINDASTDDLAILFFKNELELDITTSDISRSRRIGKRSTKPWPIILRLTRHNTKVKILQKRRVLKEKKWPFLLQDLTQQRRNILKYLRETGQGKVDKVWTIDRTIFFRPTQNQALVEKCSTFKECKQFLDKYKLWMLHYVICLIIIIIIFISYIAQFPC